MRRRTREHRARPNRSTRLVQGHVRFSYPTTQIHDADAWRERRIGPGNARLQRAEAPRIRIRQGFEQHAIDNSEHCRRQRHLERDHADDRSRVPRRSSQGAQRVSNVRAESAATGWSRHDRVPQRRRAGAARRAPRSTIHASTICAAATPDRAPRRRLSSARSPAMLSASAASVSHVNMRMNTAPVIARQSTRRAFTGSTRLARSAGISVPAAAVRTMTTIAAAHTRGSYGVIS